MNVEVMQFSLFSGWANGQGSNPMIRGGLVKFEVVTVAGARRKGTGRIERKRKQQLDHYLFTFDLLKVHLKNQVSTTFDDLA